MTNLIMFLLVVFQIKHLLADFIFQNAFMLGKGKTGTAWIIPLLAHTGVHAAMTLLIVAIVNPKMALVAASFDMVTHFIIDRIKATSHLKAGVWENSEKGRLLSQFYLQLGIDQMAHHIVGLIIVFMIS